MDRAKNQWMASWLKRHPDRDEDAARSKWETLSIETKSHLMNISEMEIRIIEEIRAKLLKTLDEYQAPATLKNLFVEAIECAKF
jgi:hypothetical protein